MFENPSDGSEGGDSEDFESDFLVLHAHGMRTYRASDHAFLRVVGLAKTAIIPSVLMSFPGFAVMPLCVCDGQVFVAYLDAVLGVQFFDNYFTMRFRIVSFVSVDALGRFDVFGLAQKTVSIAMVADWTSSNLEHCRQLVVEIDHRAQFNVSAYASTVLALLADDCCVVCAAPRGLESCAVNAIPDALAFGAAHERCYDTLYECAAKSLRRLMQRGEVRCISNTKHVKQRSHQSYLLDDKSIRFVKELLEREQHGVRPFIVRSRRVLAPVPAHTRTFQLIQQGFCVTY